MRCVCCLAHAHCDPYRSHADGQCHCHGHPDAAGHGHSDCNGHRNEHRDRGDGKLLLTA